MQCVSLFSGAGGLDQGMRAAGMSLISAVESDADCCRTLKLNGFENVHQSDVAVWNSQPKPDRREPLVVVGGPPCQPFSKSAYWSRSSARGLADRRAHSLQLYFDVIRSLKPDAFLIENVEGFVTAGGVEFVESQLACLRSAGIDYRFSWQILNCADFGVPQKRRRFFGVGSLTFDFEFPQPTHGPGIGRYVTAWDAVRSHRKARSEDLELRGQWAELLGTIPEGKNYLWHTERGGGVELFGWRTRYWSFLQKLEKCAPAPTIVATPSQESGPFHWTNRQLSTRELAALQTFPSTYSFAGDRASRRRQIGNAVPPLMAEILGKTIRSAFGESVPSSLAHEVCATEHIPPPSRVRPIPEKYLPLVGPRAAHPGSGLGPNPRSTTPPPAGAREPTESTL